MRWPISQPGVPQPVDGSTLVLNGSGSGPSADDLQTSNSAMFDHRLTRTGAMMGTPAYMAPEQFRGVATDARTDQFAFCIALYEALYGERPFAGNTLMALTTNVVNGKIREAPAQFQRAGVDSQDPAARPARVAPTSATRGRPICWTRWRRTRPSRGGERRTSAAPCCWRWRWASARTRGWPIARRRAAARPRSWLASGSCAGQGEPEPARHARIREAFMKTGKSYAADVYATASRALTDYAQRWADMRKETCEATEVRKEQSAEVLDLRMSCLDERLGGLRALTDVFVDANGDVVENAVSASNALASLDRCADVPLLRAVVQTAGGRGDAREVSPSCGTSLADVEGEVRCRKFSGHGKAAPRIMARDSCAGLSAA